MLDTLATEFAMTIIKTIAMPLIMSFLTPFILSFVMHLMPAINQKMTPKIVDGCTKPLIAALKTTVEMNIGVKVSVGGARRGAAYATKPSKCMCRGTHGMPPSPPPVGCVRPLRRRAYSSPTYTRSWA